MVRHTVLALLLAGCAGPAAREARPTPPAAPPGRFLYVWAGDLNHDASDFLAVYDVQRGSPTYAQLLTTVPVEARRTHPHHLEYELPAGRLLFASGYGAERLFLFDHGRAAGPRLVRTLAPPHGFRYPHDMLRLANGNVLVSHLGTDSAGVDQGGIVEYDPRGEVLRSAHSGHPAAGGPVRTYAMAALPELDRLVSTSAPMHQRTTAHVVQVWRLSTLELLHTLPLPEGPAEHLRQMPFVPRVMADGRTVLLNTFGCGFYRVTGLESAAPAVRFVRAIADRFADCGVPVLAGRYWVMPVGKLSRLVTFDVSDPERPREVGALQLDTTFRPHWLAADPGSDRLIAGGENGGEDRMLMARLDRRSGALSLDESFAEVPGTPGISFRRDRWPHGATGGAFAHAALFRP